MTDLRTEPVQVRWTRRSSDAIAIVAGLAVLAAGMIVVRNGTVPGWEHDGFDVINDLPGWLYPLLWPVQQLGAIVVGPVVALVAALTRTYRLAVAAVLATAGKLLLEDVVKAMVSRQRPGTSIGGDIELRGDVSVSGESFMSATPCSSPPSPD